MRIPVVTKENAPLMPTTPSRARRWLKSGKAIKQWSDVGLFYVQLTVDPSALETQPVVVGIDPGKLYSGIGVQSARFTLFMAHLELPFKTVKKRMETRATMRRTRRSRRIDRTQPFELRNHRQARFSNRKSKKVAPSIRANRQLELRVVTELSRIFPISKIVWEYVKADVDLTSGRKKARSGKGFSAVMVGQKWAIEQLSKLAPVVKRLGWQTANIRRQLGLVKAKDKSLKTSASHAVDGVALAASEFINYESFHTANTHGKAWNGSVVLTDAVFQIIRRPPISRRQLHLLQFAKGGKRRAYGGTTTRHGFRKGDLVSATQAGRDSIGWVSGDTARQVSVSNFDWKRLAQFTASKVTLIKRSTGLLVSGGLTPIQLTLIPPSAESVGLSGQKR